MLHVIQSQENQFVALIEISEDKDLTELEKDFNSIMNPWPKPPWKNQKKYPEYEDWLDRSCKRTVYLVEKYGSEDNEMCVDSYTFVNFLILEHNARLIGCKAYITNKR